MFNVMSLITLLYLFAGVSNILSEALYASLFDISCFNLLFDKFKVLENETVIYKHSVQPESISYVL